MSRSKARAQIVRDTVRRFSHLGNRTIARHLIANYGDLFDNDVEKARSAVRHIVGKKGELNRENASDKSDFRDSPVLMPKTWSQPRHDYNLPEGLWLYMSDVHVPFHEPKPIEAAVQYGHVNEVTGILLNGDIFDYAGIGFWPTERRDFDKELEITIDFLDFLRHEFPNAKIVFKPGNHEFRLPRYFVAKAPEVATSPMAAMESVMNFEGRKIEFLDFKQKINAGGLSILHGDEIAISAAVNPARGLFLKSKVSALCGHYHRSSEHTEANLHGQVVTCWSIGCMCNLSPDYAPYNNWSWGTGLISVGSKGNGFEVESRRILPSGKLK
jgi:hypothetical protein